MSLLRQRDLKRTGRLDAQATEVLNRHILSTATRLFLEQGYAETSMEQVATAAGAGKQTIYRRYSSKEELFADVISDLCRVLLEPGLVTSRETSDPLATLRETCRETLELVAKPLPAAFYRILIAEGVRFPSLVDRVTQTAIEPLHELIRHLLKAACDAGQLRRDYPVEDMFRALSGMTSGWFIQQKLLGQHSLSSEEERSAFFDSTWSLFLNGAAIP